MEENEKGKGWYKMQGQNVEGKGKCDKEYKKTEGWKVEEEW